MTRWLAELREIVYSSPFSRYLVASGFALLTDYGSYWLLANHTGLTLQSAAALGYGIGLFVAYFLITKRVFKDGWLRKKKHFEMLLFATSGAIGISVTYVVVFLYIKIVDIDLHTPKLVAVGTSFLFVYLFRRYVVFRAENEK